MSVCAQEWRCPIRGVRSLEAGVTSSCELSHMGAKKKLGSSTGADK